MARVYLIKRIKDKNSKTSWQISFLSSLQKYGEENTWLKQHNEEIKPIYNQN